MHEYHQKLDASGLNCPLPLLKAKKALSQMAVGEVLYLISTDQGAVADMQALAQQCDYKFLSYHQSGAKYHFFLQK